MGNLKNAVRAQWRPDFDTPEGQGNIVEKTLVNLVTLLGLIVLIVVTFALAAVSTSLSRTRGRPARPGPIGWLAPVLRFVPIVLLHRCRVAALHVPLRACCPRTASRGRSSGVAR